MGFRVSINVSLHVFSTTAILALNPCEGSLMLHESSGINGILTATVLRIPLVAIRIFFKPK